jgi:hypothetical protein
MHGVLIMCWRGDDVIQWGGISGLPERRRFRNCPEMGLGSFGSFAVRSVIKAPMER